MQAISEKRGRTAEPANAIDATFMGVSWDVRESYRIEGGPDDRTTILVASGSVVRQWSPIVEPSLPDNLSRLADAPDEILVAWSNVNGAFGIERPLPLGERLVDIREELQHLQATRALARALLDHPGDEALIDLARSAAGHTVDPLRIAEGTPIPTKGPRYGKHAAADIQALNALGKAIASGLRRRVLTGAIVTGNERDMRLQGSLTAVGPIAAAHLRTLAECARLRISIERGTRRLDWRQPRPCERCGTIFSPTREAQRWCSPQCRWAASKTPMAVGGRS